MSHSLGMFIILILILIQLGLLGFNFVTYYFRSEGHFYSTTPNGKTRQLAPSLRPNVSTKALLSWATLAGIATFTLDFLNIDKNIEDLKIYFTKAGFENFLLALESDDVIGTIRSKKLVLSAVPIGPSIVLDEDEVGGFHTWTIQVPITVSYLSSSAEEKRNKLITVWISQVPTQEANTGIGIVRYEAVEVSPEILRDLI